MTRLNETATIEKLSAEVSSLKKQVEKERRQRRRRLLIKVVFIAALLLLVFGGGGFALARSGLYRPPLLAWVPYETPAPLREVASRAIDVQKLYGALRGFPAKKKETALSFSEGELTGLLREVIINDVDRPVMSPLQVAITPDEVELFGTLRRPVRAYLTIGIKPTVRDGSTELDVTRLRLGQLALPAGSATGAVRLTAQKTLDALFEKLGQYGKVTSYELSEGSITIKLTAPDDEN